MTFVTTCARSLLLIGAIVLSVGTIRAADVPGKPVEFQAKVVEANASGAMVKLLWMTNRDGGTPESFDVYMATANDQSDPEFDKIGSVEASANELTYDFLTDRLEPGTYLFYIVAVNASGHSDPSVTRSVVIKKAEDPKPFIEITSARAIGTSVGKPWEFKVTIQKKGEFTSIVYTLDDQPDGVTINQETGVMNWKEPKEGRYEFTIIVTGTLANGETVVTKQRFVLEVGKADNKPCAEIVGTVKDGDGKPAEGVVTVWMIKAGDNNTEKWMPIYKAPVNDGHYGVGVPAGTYKLRFESDRYEAEWFEDANELVDAKSLEISCDAPRREVNFVVTKMPEPVFHVASGKVIDAETGEPLKNALVVFAPTRNNSNAPKGKEVRAETNADGEYEVKLVEGVTYLASAVARLPQGTKNLYLQEWWENTHDVSLAKGISLTDDMGNVDFPMDLRQDYDNGLSGTMVANESLDPVVGKVVAYMIESNGKEPNKNRAETVNTDSTGTFAFTNMLPGKYVIYGIPDQRPWVPGWYVRNERADTKWKQATQVEVGETGNVTEIEIRLLTAEKESGRGRISGHCYNADGGVIAKSNGVVQGAIPVPGALVVATNAQGTVVDYAIADIDGAYLLELMPIGQFTVSADRVLFNPVSHPIEITDQSLDATTEFGLNPIVSSVEVPTNLVGTTLNLYPNPATNTASLMFTSEAGNATTTVIDVTGTALWSATTVVNGGPVTLSIPTSGIATGMVLVRVTNGTTSFALPLQIVR